MLNRKRIVSILFIAFAVASGYVIHHVLLEHDQPRTGDHNVPTRLVRYEDDSTYGLAAVFPLAEIESPKQLKFSVKLNQSVSDRWNLSSASVFSVSPNGASTCATSRQFDEPGACWLTDCPDAGAYAVELYFRKAVDKTTTTALKDALRDPGNVSVKVMSRG